MWNKLYTTIKSWFSRPVKPKPEWNTRHTFVRPKDPTRDPKHLGANYTYKGFASNNEKAKKRKVTKKNNAISRKRKSTK